MTARTAMAEAFHDAFGADLEGMITIDGNADDVTADASQDDTPVALVDQGDGGEGDGGEGAPAAPEPPAAEDDADLTLAEILTEQFQDAPEVGKTAPPEHWPADRKQWFRSLTEQQQAYALDHDKETARAFTEQGQKAVDAVKLHEHVATALKPYEAAMAAQGISAQDALDRLFAAEHALRTDPANALLTLAGQYGRQVAGTERAAQFVKALAQQMGVAIGAPASGAATVTPQQGALNELAQRQTALEDQIAADRRSGLQHSVARATETLKTFVEAKDESGNPAHPHFEAVRPMIAAIYQAAAARGEKVELKDAYEQAVWATPALRAAQIKTQAEKDAAAAALARKEAADKARRTRSPQGKAGRDDGPSFESFEQALKAEFRAA